MEFNDIVALKELLCPNDDRSSDSELEDDEKDVHNEGKEQTGEKRKRKVNPYSKKEEDSSEKEAKDVYNVDDETLYKIETDNDALKWKKTPTWDIAYKQQVTPEDMFLQMSGRGPATASCEEMILKISLPGEDYHNVDLKITEQNLALESPKYSLNVPLVQPVDPKQGNAQWDKEKETLIVTLSMNREFDYINF